MKIEGYNFRANLDKKESSILLGAWREAELIVLTENDAMWHYMTTGQVLEGQIDGRTDTGNTEEGTDR